MPRSYKLTWQLGVGYRTGRWRKKYKGKVYYFAGGRGKSDRDAYDAALADWEKLKLRIDAEAPKPHQADYLRAIAEWEQVLTWSRKHQDDQMADLAVAKLNRLRKDFSVATPRPVSIKDTFAGRFDRSVRYPGLDKALAELGMSVVKDVQSDISQFAHLPEYTEYLAACDRFVGKMLGTPAGRVDPEVRTVVVPAMDCFDQPDRLALEMEVWRDRLDVMQRETKSRGKTVKDYVEAYLADKRADADAGELTIGRVDKLRTQLSHFQVWLGSEGPVTEINSKTLRDYKTKLLENVEAGVWSRTTASERISSIKSFVRWLWQYEAIAYLPRAMAPKSKLLDIGKSYRKIVDFDRDEIRRLLTKASDRTRLYIVLMLNCGMTQKDISDLRQEEVDNSVGRITRKRSKTRGHANVPEVSYLLWPETLALIQQERSSDESGRLLLNERGGPLWSEEIDKPLKSLKKTSASLIRSSRDYKGLEDLFLGHAPQKMSDRHYAKPPQEMLDEAVTWLREQFSIST